MNTAFTLVNHEAFRHLWQFETVNVPGARCSAEYFMIKSLRLHSHVLGQFFFDFCYRGLLFI